MATGDPGVPGTPVVASIVNPSGAGGPGTTGLIWSARIRLEPPLTTVSKKSMDFSSVVRLSYTSRSVGSRRFEFVIWVGSVGSTGGSGGVSSQYITVNLNLGAPKLPSSIFAAI